MVIDDFYSTVQKDSILSIPFQSVHDWPDHVKKLTYFLWIRFGGTPYKITAYEPITKHYFAGFNQERLTQWLKIFHETLKDRLSGPQHDLWKVTSERMGSSLLMRKQSIIQEKGDANDL